MIGCLAVSGFAEARRLHSVMMPRSRGIRTHPESLR
jgi:hypothetical protein